MIRDTYPKYQTPAGNWTTSPERAERLWEKARYEAMARADAQRDVIEGQS